MSITCGLLALLASAPDIRPVDLVAVT